MKKIWRIWAKALGEKASECSRESDVVAIVRTLIFISYFATNIFIVAGVIRHWNGKQSTGTQEIYYCLSDTSTCYLLKKK